MPTDRPLAHSAHNGVAVQSYLEHISNVSRNAAQHARNAASFYSGDRRTFLGVVENAALYHDIGKLDAANQDVLEKDSRTPLPINHVDAGVAALWGLNRKEPAVLVAAHHAGLFSKSEESPPNKKRLFRDERPLPTLNNCTVDNYVDTHLSAYLTAHENAGLISVGRDRNTQLHRCGFTRRVALSCLVDADHGDTAHHYGNEVETPEIEPRWMDRLKMLQQYVNRLPPGETERERKRNILRRHVFNACRDAPFQASIRTCDAPVGSGKTTAVMAHLLRVAAERKPQLRHIIVVLPYTSIITQSVDIYREALVLKGERPEDVVAEHHHKADFSKMELRQLATLWRAPIIVTTAVQFFETLASHHPAQLRKLHELPGSAVFIDEMHAAIPSHLWPQAWRWLQIWTREWGGHLVLASGSLSRFWELDEYKSLITGSGTGDLPNVPDLIEEETLRAELKKTEQKRILYKRRPDEERALDCEGLISFVHNVKGPRLLIVNTVQTAAVIAKKMREAGCDVLHLSTALTPVHRDVIVAQVKCRLKQDKNNWTLVATSCVEAGMNFSFRTGFRERASTASLIQIGGRVSRGGEYDGAIVWDLLLRDDMFRDNPAVTIGRQALDRFTLEELNGMQTADLATTSMKREWTCGGSEKAQQIIDLEHAMEYPSVSAMSKVIEADTRMVLIDKSLAEAVLKGEKVSSINLIRNSVQIWAKKIDKLGIEPLIHSGKDSYANIYVWKLDYDPEFLGYMSGVLKLEEFISAGGMVI